MAPFPILFDGFLHFRLVYPYSDKNNLCKFQNNRIKNADFIG